ncbi:hypothetical protein LET06_02280 [Pectobacterium versatile]|uniref:hypothetical protein n=1 Tax=Pectobacterium versatile TaxID=2488639 RepID=UPI001CE0F160|nr:hypothetical protein [Pectobacterium versatile]MCA5929791.1 hypothetical protein [Pectobacterium versatile]MCA5946987.1 hypothetical protein [Pectobacterium versatile]MCA5950874.1 hypothetical protein [Pectobacterium versatile]UCP84469.1 hypothetical protein LGL96_13720 [Pectobacterium versatile]
MSIFKNEREMQLWLEEILEDQEGLIDLIIDFESIDNYVPKNSVAKKLQDCSGTLNLAT